MHDADATPKGRRLRGEEGVGSGVSDQPVEGSPVPGPGVRFLSIRQRGPRPGARDVGEAVDPERIAFAHEQRGAEILREEARLPLDHSKLAQLPQRVWPGHDDIGVEPGLAADVEREVAERDPSRAEHLHDDGLGDGHHHDVVHIEVSVAWLRSGPRREGADDVIAEQHHQVITLGKDHEARWCADPADDIRYGVRVTGERSNTGRQLRDDGPHERLQGRRCWSVFYSGCRVRLLASEGDRAERGPEERAPLHGGNPPSRREPRLTAPRHLAPRLAQQALVRLRVLLGRDAEHPVLARGGDGRAGSA